MHMRAAEAGVVGTSAIVGGNPPHAVGYALADKMLGRDNVSVTFFGDGAAQNGRLLRGDEHRRRTGRAGDLLHREQSLRRLDADRRDHPRDAPDLARRDARHSGDRGRWHGCRGRSPRHGRGPQHHRGEREGRSSSRPCSTAISTSPAAGSAATSATAARRKRITGARAIP